MAFEENTLLFGSDPTPRIVAIELGETGTVKVYRREKDGATTADFEPFHPFVWCDSDVTDLNLEAEKLEGDLRYGWRVSVNSWKELIALRNGLKSAGRSFFALSDPVQHYLTATGRTLFKGLPFEELRRLHEDASDAARYSEIAGRLGMPVNTLKSHVHRFRVRYRELLCEEVAHTVATPGEVEAELRHLRAILAA
jgi:hypothetical protein